MGNGPERLNGATAIVAAQRIYRIITIQIRVSVSGGTRVAVMRGDGDGWVVGTDGSRRWGRFGAAGLVVRAPAADGTPVVLLQHRVWWSHHGGTWGVPGGARDSHESAADAAIREAGEEAGIDPAAIVVRDTRVTADLDSGRWTYTSVLAETAAPLPTVPSGESAELRWVPEHEVETYALHPGFAASWSALRVREVAVESVEVDAGQRLVRLAEGYGWLPGVPPA